METIQHKVQAAIPTEQYCASIDDCEHSKFPLREHLLLANVEKPHFFKVLIERSAAFRNKSTMKKYSSTTFSQ
jgi:hypothetical protein